MESFLYAFFACFAAVSAALVSAALHKGKNGDFLLLFRKRFLVCAGIVVLAAAAGRLLGGIRSGIVISVTPDAVEYYWGALRLSCGERFGITLNGVWYPSRYTPYFSLLLTPFVRLAGGEVWGAGVCSALATLTVLGLLMFVLYKAQDLSAGVLAAGMILLYPGVIHCGNMARQEPAYTALLAGMFCLYLHAVRRGSLSRPVCLSYALLAAVCGALRCTGYGMLLPFLLLILRDGSLKRPQKIAALAAVILPSLCAVCATAVFNGCVFGSPLRSGYHFHCPLPYEFPELLFSPGYIIDNLRHIVRFEARAGVMLPAAFAVTSVCALRILASGRKSPETRLFLSAWLWCSLHLLYCVVLYLPHFYFAMRFFLPSGVFFMFLLGWSCRLLLEETRADRDCAAFGAAAAGILFAAAGALDIPVDYAGREIAALRHCAKALPRDAVLIHDCDTGRAEIFFCRGTARRQIPSDRSLGYAGLVGLSEKLKVKPRFPLSLDSQELSDFLKKAPGSVIFFPMVWENDAEEILRRYVDAPGGLFIMPGAFSKLSPERRNRLKKSYSWTYAGSAPQGDGVLALKRKNAGNGRCAE